MSLERLPKVSKHIQRVGLLLFLQSLLALGQTLDTKLIQPSHGLVWSICIIDAR